MLWHFLFFVAVIIIVISCIILQKMIFRSGTYLTVYLLILVWFLWMLHVLSINVFTGIKQEVVFSCKENKTAVTHLEVALGRWKQLDAAWSSHNTPRMSRAKPRQGFQWQRIHMFCSFNFRVRLKHLKIVWNPSKKNNIYVNTFLFCVIAHVNKTFWPAGAFLL